MPIFLFSCSGSNNEAVELKRQLEIAEQKNQELIQKAESEAKVEAEAKANQTLESFHLKELDLKKPEPPGKEENSYFKLLSKHPKYDCMNKDLNVFVDVFGIYLISHNSIPEEYILHSANILAEFIDNDMDGIPDEQKVWKYLVNNNYVVPVWTQKLREDYFQNVRGTYCEDNIRMGASMYYGEDQWAIGGINERGTWDTNLEEIWHIISRGWYNVYLEEFGNHENVNRSSKLRDAMDLARGGKFEFVPESYPENAWYTYYDQSCIYQCQASEYFYWALMANIGALDPLITDKCDESKHEWYICTKDDLKITDKAMYDLLNNSKFKLPKNIPQGNYSVN